MEKIESKFCFVFQDHTKIRATGGRYIYYLVSIPYSHFCYAHTYICKHIYALKKVTLFTRESIVRIVVAFS